MHLSTIRCSAEHETVQATALGTPWNLQGVFVLCECRAQAERRSGYAAARRFATSEENSHREDQRRRVTATAGTGNSRVSGCDSLQESDHEVRSDSLRGGFKGAQPL